MNFPFKLPLVLDGATGSYLMANGLENGVCPEQWILENPHILTKLQKDYLSAGSDIILAPTFGANRQKLKDYGLEQQVEQINKKLVDLTRKNVGKSALIAGDLSTSGLMVKPYGEASFDQIYEIYYDQAYALKLAGVDLLFFETQMFLSDMRAGVLAAKQLDLPVFVSMTIEENGRTIMGEDPLAIMIVLQAMGADAIGINCSCGPDKLIKQLHRLVDFARVPLIAKPNAGIPCKDNPFEYDISPDEFARQMSKAFDMGIHILGGCCGTNPDYIKKLKNITISKPKYDFTPTAKDYNICVINGTAMFLNDENEFSEHIACNYDMIDDILDIEDDGKKILLIDINSIDDADLFLENVHMIKMPVAIYCDDANIVEYTLKNYQGRLIVNMDCSIDKFILKNFAAKYGAIIY